MKNKFLIYGVCFFSFIFAGYVSAGDVIDQQQLGTGGGYLFDYGYEFGQSFVPQQNNITKITASIYSNTPQLYTVKLYSGSFDTGTELATTSAYIAGGGIYTGNFIFSELIPVIAGNQYYFKFTATTTQFKADGAQGLYDYGLAYPTGFLDDLYFITYYDSNYYNLTPILPLSGSFYATSTVNFKLSWQAPDLTKTFVVMQLNNLGNNTFQLIDGFNITALTGSHEKQKTLIDGHYSWFSYFYDNGNEFATTSIESFYVSTITDTTATTSCIFDISECENVSGIDFYQSILCGFKKFSIWAICPPQWSVDRLGDSYEIVKGSFPFSAFFDITDTVKNAISTTTTNMDDSFSVPFISATGTIYMTPVLASSSLSTALGSANANLIRNSLKWIFWIFAIFVTYLTLKR